MSIENLGERNYRSCGCDAKTDVWALRFGGDDVVVVAF